MSYALSEPGPGPGDAMLTTTEAGRLVGRTGTAVRMAIDGGDLQGVWDRDHWLVSESAVASWAARTPPGRGAPLPVPRTDEVMRLLEEYASASAEEIAVLLGVHPGNARKYLALLGLQGRAVRRPDGQWVLAQSVTAAEEVPNKQLT